ncbi:UNVERIFIED_CONTAM: ABC transporter ATP-binding protein, partial [Bacillus sp. ATCC 13368]
MLFRFVWRYLRTRLLEVIGIIVLQVIATIAALNLPNLNARIIDEGVAQGDTDLIWELGAIMMGIT